MIWLRQWEDPHGEPAGPGFDSLHLHQTMGRYRSNYHPDVTPLKCPICGKYMELEQVTNYYRKTSKGFITVNEPSVYYQWYCDYCVYEGPRASASAWGGKS